MLLQEEGNATVIADTQFATSFLSLCQKCTSRGPGGGLSFSFGTCGKNTSCRASGSAWICKVEIFKSWQRGGGLNSSLTLVCLSRLVSTALYTTTVVLLYSSTYYTAAISSTVHTSCSLRRTYSTRTWYYSYVYCCLFLYDVLQPGTAAVIYLH